RLTHGLARALVDFKSPSAQRDRLIAAVRKQRLAPLREHLQARGTLPPVRRLFVVPTEKMAQVPVEVLAPEYTVSYVPSGTIFARLMEQHRPLSGSSLLALADPVYQPPVARLPGTRIEAESLCRLV